MSWAEAASRQAKIASQRPEETGLEASQIISLARAFASTRPAMILLGGSSMHKGANGWHAARAISSLSGNVRLSPRS